MRENRLIPFLALLCSVLLLFPGCRKELEVVEGGAPVQAGGVPLSLALSVGQPSPTRTVDPIAQDGTYADVFQGIQDLRVIPYKTKGTIGTADQSNGWPILLGGLTGGSAGGDQNGALVNNNNSVLYLKQLVPRGTASFLLYGVQKDDGSDATTHAYKRHYGSTVVAGLEGKNINPAGISFTPDPILQGTPDATTAAALVGYLNSLVGASNTYTLYYRRNYTTYNFNTTLTWNASISDQGLRNIFTTFTGNGELIAGSGTGVAALISSLYKELKNYNNTSTDPYQYTYGTTQYNCYYESSRTNQVYVGNLHNRFRDFLIGRIEALPITIGSAPNYPVTFNDATLQNYPGQGLPDGSVAIKWNGSNAFIVADESTLDLLMPLDKFCYPPRLWYYANSLIDTSELSDMTSGVYVPANATWDDILSQYEIKNGTVYPETRSAALVQPAQYGMGLLELTLKQLSVNVLLDNEDVSQPVNNTNFPVTGLIICGQKQLAFNFTPVGADDYNLYDTDFTGTAYLSSTQGALALRSLVYPTPDTAPVNFAIELQNNSSQSFVGASGVISPGSKFYLMGKLTPTGSFNNVFLSDHKTTVNITVASLKEAYNTVPDVRDPQLQIGVKAQIDWIQSTSVNVPLF